jgi:hypothetical protein
VGEVVAVLEGAARAAQVPADVPGLAVVLAAADGDTAVVEVVAAQVRQTGAAEGPVVVVTADRGLRGRLPADAAPVGPRWLLDVLDG